MKRLKPSVLLIGVGICVPLLALQRFGVMREVAEALLKTYRGSILPASTDLHHMPALQYAVQTMLAFFTAWICAELTKQWQRFAFIAGLSFLIALLSPVLAMQGVLFEPFSGMIAIVGSGLAAMMFAVSERGSRVQLFRHFFVDRLRAADFEELVRGEEPVKLAGTRELTSLTCRILNSRELTEAMPAEEFEKLSSAFMLSASEFLVANGGYLDVCNSQGITVQFGFPIRDEDHALSASHVALQLRDHLGALSTELATRWKHKPVLGIALASGACACGLIGHRAFQFYSALGEAPELSRRVCNMNGVYGSQVLIAATTFNLVKDLVEVRPMELIAAPGHTGLREVYELLGKQGSLSEGEAKARDAFWQGVVALRQGDAKNALAKLQQALVIGKDDAPLKYFKQRAETLQKGDKSHVRESVQAG